MRELGPSGDPGKTYGKLGSGNRRSAVLAYHAIGAAPRDARLYNSFVPRETFRAQMEFLARRRNVVPLDQLVDGVFPTARATVAITFDDGYRSVLTDAAPILREYEFPATVFVPSKWLGARNAWDPPYDLPLDIVSAEELLELRELGLEIGSHGHAHIDFSKASPAEAEADIRTSVERLTEILGEPPRHLSFPYGRSSEAARNAAAASGFREAFALGVGEGRFAQERVSIYPYDKYVLWFAFKTSGRYTAWRKGRFVSSAYSLVRPLVRPPRKP
jgi:peptidoglycan/xylan/chitin deacetylase (PgdA/CDA1 family)